MSTLQVTPDRVVLRLTATEKLAAVHGDLAVPRAAITTVELVEDGIGAARGLRAPGLGIPGRRKLGTWRSRTGRQFVDVRRAQPPCGSSSPPDSGTHGFSSGPTTPPGWPASSTYSPPPVRKTARYVSTPEPSTWPAP